MAKKKTSGSPQRKSSKRPKAASDGAAAGKKPAKKAARKGAKKPARKAMKKAGASPAVRFAARQPKMAMSPPLAAAAPAGAAAGATQVIVTAASLEVIIHKNWGTPPRIDEMLIQATDSLGNIIYKHQSTPATLNLTKALLASLAAAGWQLPWKFKATGWRIDGTVP
jgi:hypothetical protein